MSDQQRNALRELAALFSVKFVESDFAIRPDGHATGKLRNPVSGIGIFVGCSPTGSFSTGEF
jgi:hypothetical protein